MPDKRKHRGAHPEDGHLFRESQLPPLRSAVMEFSWLLSRGYAQDSALALAGNRHNLTDRQRLAVRRASCSDQGLEHRRRARTLLSQCVGRPLGIDGYNLLITIESALSGGLVLVGRDGCTRDLASIHGTYRKVEETLPAVDLIAGHLQRAGIARVDWLLDRPVSNSGRLRGLMTEALASSAIKWNIELVDNPDPILAAFEGAVVTSDAWILDRCHAWVNLAADIIEAALPRAWKVDLR